MKRLHVQETMRSMHETSSTWNDRLTHRPPSWGVPGARCCRKFVKIFKLDRSMTRPLKILTNFLQQSDSPVSRDDVTSTLPGCGSYLPARHGGSTDM